MLILSFENFSKDDQHHVGKYSVTRTQMMKDDIGYYSRVTYWLLKVTVVFRICFFVTGSRDWNV